MDTTALRRQYAWNLAYADALTRDVPPELWAVSGGPGLENHPAWTIGHLITGSALVLEGLGGAPGVPDAWTELFLRRGPGDPRRPDPDAAAYPDRATLMAALADLHARVDRRLAELEPAALQAAEEWRFDGWLPTQGDCLLFMLVSHEGVHLGQLGCWRRRFELPSAMASMGRGPAG